MCLYGITTDLLPIHLKSNDSNGLSVIPIVIHTAILIDIYRSSTHMWNTYLKMLRPRVSVYNIVLFCGLDEYVYEIGAQIFLTSLRQSRFNESMAFLPNAVQNEILNRTWHQSFVLMAAFWPMNLITLLSGWASYMISTV